MSNEQPQRASGNRRQRMRVAWRVYWVVYGTLVLVAYPVLTFVSALGAHHLLPGLTLRESVGLVVYVLAFAVIGRFVALPLYRNAWHTLPPAWWRWTIVGGVLAAVAGLAVAGLVALLHTQMGDGLAIPLYVSSICVAFAGIVAFGVGSIAMGLALGRHQRQERDRLSGQAPPSPIG